MRRGPGTLYRRLQTLRFALTRDRAAILQFLRAGPVPLPARLALLGQLARVTNHVRGYHDNADILRVGGAILRRPGAVVVEAGAGYGSSTAKLSRFVRAAGGRLLVFDSFRGIPDNEEVHENLDGRRVVFRAGAFRGRERAVRRVVERFGAPEVCTFVKGDFADTLRGFEEAIDVALLDVDLIRSTRICVRALHPRLRPGGVMFSQDGHLRATVALLEDPVFWRAEVGREPPVVDGLGRAKLLAWSATPAVAPPPAAPSPPSSPG
jgi:O-methyltransferase